jgi:hypothetical protein
MIDEGCLCHLVFYLCLVRAAARTTEEAAASTRLRVGSPPRVGRAGGRPGPGAARGWRRPPARRRGVDVAEHGWAVCVIWFQVVFAATDQNPQRRPSRQADSARGVPRHHDHASAGALSQSESEVPGRSGPRLAWNFKISDFVSQRHESVITSDLLI